MCIRIRSSSGCSSSVISEQASDVFGAGEESKKLDLDEADTLKLHAKIGQLTLENDFLAKALGR